MDVPLDYRDVAQGLTEVCFPHSEDPGMSFRKQNSLALCR